MLAILSADNAKLQLEKHAVASGTPWAIIKEPCGKMLEELRAGNIFIAEAQDSETANKIHDAVTVQEKSAMVGLVRVMTRDEARKALDASGAKIMGFMWSMAKTAVFSFVDYLYTQNLFLTLAEPPTAQMIRDKTTQNSLYLKIKDS